VATINFTRQEIEGVDSSVPINMPIDLLNTGSTATFGLDYCTGLPPLGTIAVGSGGVFEEIVVKSDNFQEGTETINISIQNPCFCEPEIFTLEIIDVPPMEVRPLEGDTACFGMRILLQNLNLLGQTLLVW